ncbi:hypothetical protein [Rhizobium laguerreae]|uniref:hypothetical protein n=1 Tax=Rhizobium laguerreae TaxID=1076926 RepID=UPI001C9257DD|nr:hypothetical protein [Rhizobium laguerreae]MBY3136106.1 hypothetical protein [Rhizobium laguerreae]
MSSKASSTDFENTDGDAAQGAGTQPDHGKGENAQAVKTIATAGINLLAIPCLPVPGQVAVQLP